jgi:hypothetical protein
MPIVSGFLRRAGSRGRPFDRAYARTQFACGPAVQQPAPLRTERSVASPDEQLCGFQTVDQVEKTDGYLTVEA